MCGDVISNRIAGGTRRVFRVLTRDYPGCRNMVLGTANMSEWGRCRMPRRPVFDPEVQNNVSLLTWI